MKHWLVMMTVMLGSLAGIAQPPAAPKLFTEPTLGFRYAPPEHFYDLTSFMRQSQQNRAQQLGKKSVLNLVLSLQSGPDDTAKDWQSITIQSYPRAQITAATDRDAAAKFAGMTSGKRGSLVHEVLIGKTHFGVTELDEQEGTLKKHAVIYATVLGEQAVSFAFAGNDAGAVESAAESMKSFEKL